MRQNLTLVLGKQGDYVWLIRLLEDWGMRHPEVEFTTESIHADPSKAVRLHVTQLPALIYNDHVVAQGDPVTWVTRLLDLVLFSNSSGDS